jgi:hypothetical protein
MALVVRLHHVMARDGESAESREVSALVSSSSGMRANQMAEYTAAFEEPEEFPSTAGAGLPVQGHGAAAGPAGAAGGSAAAARQTAPAAAVSAKPPPVNGDDAPIGGGGGGSMMDEYPPGGGPPPVYDEPPAGSAADLFRDMLYDQLDTQAVSAASAHMILRQHFLPLAAGRGGGGKGGLPPGEKAMRASVLQDWVGDMTAQEQELGLRASAGMGAPVQTLSEPTLDELLLRVAEWLFQE